MAGGTLTIDGDVGDHAASTLPGSMDGMRGGTFIVRGFGPAPFQMNGGRGAASPAVNKAAGPGEPVTASVLLDADIARSVLNEDPGLHVARRNDDGSVVIELAVRSSLALRNFVLTLLDRAELLGPPELRADLVDWLAALADEDAA